MKTPVKAILPAAIAAALMVPSAFAAEESSSSVKDFVEKGSVKYNFRMRHENVDAGGADNNATTLLSRASLQSGKVNGFSAFAEVDNVFAFNDNYNDSNNGKPGPAIIDPTGTDINQVYIAYDNFDTNFKYGRQRILLDNQRFVGGVGFRQNEQTYNAFSFKNTSVENLSVFAAQVTGVNRIFGSSVAKGIHDNDTQLFNLNYAASPAANITAYNYRIENLVAAAFSTNTLGARITGAFGDKDATQLTYAVEFARQNDAANNPKDYSANYSLLEAAVKTKPVTFKLGREVLGAEAGGFFVTPLATLHAFQGWADVFLNGGLGNIDSGIRDTYFSASTKLGGFKLMAVYHDFKADRSAPGMDSLGDEIGLLVAKQVNKNLNLSVKYADYNAKDFGKDTQKLWLTAQLKF